MGDIRAYPPGAHAGIVVLRLADQSVATVTQAIGDLASLADTRHPDRCDRGSATRPAANPPPMTVLA